MAENSLNTTKNSNEAIPFKLYSFKLSICTLKEITLVITIFWFINRLVGLKDCYHVAKDVKLTNNITPNFYAYYLNTKFINFISKPSNKIDSLPTPKFLLSAYADSDSMSATYEITKPFAQLNQIMKERTFEGIFKILNESLVKSQEKKKYFIEEKLNNGNKKITYTIPGEKKFFDVFIDQFPSQNFFTKRICQYLVVFRLVKTKPGGKGDRMIRTSERLKEDIKITLNSEEIFPNDPNKQKSDFNLILTYDKEYDGHGWVIDHRDYTPLGLFMLWNGLAERLDEIIEDYSVIAVYYNINYKKYFILNLYLNYKFNSAPEQGNESYCFDSITNNPNASFVRMFFVSIFFFFVADLIIFVLAVKKQFLCKKKLESNADLNNKKFLFDTNKSILQKIELDKKLEKKNINKENFKLVCFVLPILGAFQFAILTYGCYYVIAIHAQASKLSDLKFESEPYQSNPLIVHNILKYGRLIKNFNLVYFWLALSSFIRIIVLSKYCFATLSRVMSPVNTIFSLFKKKKNFLIWLIFLCFSQSSIFYFFFGDEIVEFRTWSRCFKLSILALIPNWRWLILIESKSQQIAIWLGIFYYLIIGLLLINLIRVEFVSDLVSINDEKKLIDRILASKAAHPFYKISRVLSNLKIYLFRIISSKQKNKYKRLLQEEKDMADNNMDENLKMSNKKKTTLKFDWDQKITSKKFKYLHELENSLFPSESGKKEIFCSSIAFLSILIIMIINSNFEKYQVLQHRPQNLKKGLIENYELLYNPTSLINFFTSVLPQWIDPKEYSLIQHNKNTASTTFTKEIELISDFYFFPKYYKSQPNKNEFKNFFKKHLPSSAKLSSKLPITEAEVKIERLFKRNFKNSTITTEPVKSRLKYYNSTVGFATFPKDIRNASLLETFQLALDGNINSDLQSAKIALIYRIKGEGGAALFEIILERERGDSFTIKVANSVMKSKRKRVFVTEVILIIFFIIRQLYIIYISIRKNKIRHKIYRIWKRFEINHDSKLSVMDRKKRWRKRPEWIRELDYLEIGKSGKELVHFFIYIIVLVCFIYMRLAKGSFYSVYPKPNTDYKTYTSLVIVLNSIQTFIRYSFVLGLFCLYDVIESLKLHKKTKIAGELYKASIESFRKFFVPSFFPVIIFGSITNLYYNIIEANNNFDFDFYEVLKLSLGFSNYFETRYEISDSWVSFGFVFMVVLLNFGFSVSFLSHLYIQAKEILNRGSGDSETDLKLEIGKKADFCLDLDNFLKRMIKSIPNPYVNLFIKKVCKKGFDPISKSERIS